MATARAFHTATLLRTGRVLFAGGFDKVDSSVAITSVELYDPASGTWSTADSMTKARALHTATPLVDGRILVAGGVDGVEIRTDAELYDWAGSRLLIPVVGRD